MKQRIPARKNQREVDRICDLLSELPELYQQRSLQLTYEKGLLIAILAQAVHGDNSVLWQLEQAIEYIKEQQRQ